MKVSESSTFRFSYQLKCFLILVKTGNFRGIITLWDVRLLLEILGGKGRKTMWRKVTAFLKEWSTAIIAVIAVGGAIAGLLAAGWAWGNSLAARAEDNANKYTDAQITVIAKDISHIRSDIGIIREDNKAVMEKLDEIAKILYGAAATLNAHVAHHPPPAKE